jgi:hypothetical protein
VSELDDIKVHVVVVIYEDILNYHLYLIPLSGASFGYQMPVGICNDQAMSIGCYMV